MAKSGRDVKQRLFKIEKRNTVANPTNFLCASIDLAQGCTEGCVQQHTRAMAAAIFGASGDSSALVLADGSSVDLEQQDSLMLRLELAGLFAGVSKATHSSRVQVMICACVCVCACVCEFECVCMCEGVMGGW
jgi:hypothetical protein